ARRAHARRARETGRVGRARRVARVPSGRSHRVRVGGDAALGFAVRARAPRRRSLRQDSTEPRVHPASRGAGRRHLGHSPPRRLRVLTGMPRARPRPEPKAEARRVSAHTLGRQRLTGGGAVYTSGMVRSRVRSSLLAVAFAASALGCGGGSTPTARDPSEAAAAMPLRPLPVSEADFAERTNQLLLDGEPSAERQNLLAGVVRRQLERAQARFTHGSDAAGLRALLGAFLLVRGGEFHPDLVAGSE